MKTLELGMPVGILGGGQLARMLAESALRLGLRPLVLAGSASDPASALCPDAFFGSWEDSGVVHRFLGQVKLTTYENEFIPCELLEQEARLVVPNFKNHFVPPLQALFELQDKLNQKQVLRRLEIASAPYEAWEPETESVAQWCEKMFARFKSGCVFKWAQKGYDGHGTWISPTRPTAKDLVSAIKFCEAAVARKTPLYCEEKVPFLRELAIIGCYSVTGEFTSYPLVISEQKSGICRRVYGPATALGVSAQLETQAMEHARKLAKNLRLFGSFAIEFFETEDGQLLVNEIAPRVHNSGHYTQDGCRTSQFENHWRAILGLPLGEIGAAPGFAMLNLLGPADANHPEGAPVPMPRPSSSVHLHWYGKQGIRAGRKLGHLNGAVAHPLEIPRLLEELEACEKQWVRELMDRKG